MKTNALFLLPVLLFAAVLTAQTELHSDLKPIQSYFPEQQAQVLVVGVFHFDYPGLDALKAPEEDKIDVLREPKKSEVTALVEYIKRFKPTKIAIEAFPSWETGRKYREYRSGMHRDKRDERYQLAMRIASETNLDTIYAVDAEDMTAELQALDSAFVQNLGRDFDFESDADIYTNLYRRWFEEDSKAVSRVELLDYLKYMNSAESHRYGYGAYLVGDFKLDQFRGADMLSVWWYNRNLRIFRNIQRITQGPEDRILVVIGNGHAAILRQLFESSPEYEFVEFNGL